MLHCFLSLWGAGCQVGSVPAILVYLEQQHTTHLILIVPQNPWASGIHQDPSMFMDRWSINKLPSQNGAYIIQTTFTFPSVNLETGNFLSFMLNFTGRETDFCLTSCLHGLFIANWISLEGIDLHNSWIELSIERGQVRKCLNHPLVFHICMFRNFLSP